MTERLETPVCLNCAHVMTPWFARSSSGLIEPAPGRFVCYTLLCRQYGVVTWVDPRRTHGASWEAAVAAWPT